MMQGRRLRTLRAPALIGLFSAVFALFGLSGCVEGLAMTAAAPDIRENVGDAHTELVLDPIDVWDDTGAGGYFEETIDGATMIFRLRSGGMFDEAWVRIGLIAHSKQERIYVPVVVLGQKNTIEGIRFDTDNGRASSSAVDNVDFTPGKRAFDKHIASAVFTMKPSFLQDLVKSKKARVVVSTKRGNLVADLSVVTKRDRGALRRSAKYKFKEFADKYAEMTGDKK